MLLPTPAPQYPHAFVAGGLGALFGLMNIFSRASGGIISDIIAVPFGMRGRLWVLWSIQTLGGIFCIAMSYVDHDQTATIIVMVIFSIFCQQVSVCVCVCYLSPGTRAALGWTLLIVPKI